MQSPRVMPHAGVSDSQNYTVVEFLFTGSAAGTAHAINAKQAPAAAKVWFLTGDGSADMSAAVANAIVQNADGRALGAESQNLSTGLQTYFTNVPAAADGAYCHAFAIGGVGCTDILSAEIVIRTHSTAAKNSLAGPMNAGTSTVLHSVTLSSGSLVDDAGNAIAAGTNTLVAVPQYGMCFGAVASPDVTDTIASGDSVILRLRLRA